MCVVCVYVHVCGMCVCVYIFMWCVCMFVCVYIYVVCVFVWYVCVCMHECACLCVIYFSVYVCAWMHVYMRMSVCTVIIDAGILIKGLIDFDCSLSSFGTVARFID